jgi:transposase-like protein
VVISSWRNNWPKLCTYFKYDPSIRKLVYTTNTIEGFHRQVRKVTQTMGAFTSDMALLKLIYLAYANVPEEMDSSVTKLERHYFPIGNMV